MGVGGKQHIQLNTHSIAIPCQKVEDELAKNQVVKAEEGEMMIYTPQCIQYSRLDLLTRIVMTVSIAL